MAVTAIFGTIDPTENTSIITIPFSVPASPTDPKVCYIGVENLEIRRVPFPSEDEDISSPSLFGTTVKIIQPTDSESTITPGTYKILLDIPKNRWGRFYITGKGLSLIHI